MSSSSISHGISLGMQNDTELYTSLSIVYIDFSSFHFIRISLIYHHWLNTRVTRVVIFNFALKWEKSGTFSDDFFQMSQNVGLLKSYLKKSRICTILTNLTRFGDKSGQLTVTGPHSLPVTSLLSRTIPWCLTLLSFSISPLLSLLFSPFFTNSLSLFLSLLSQNNLGI